MTKNNDSFKITAVSREDLESIGFSATNIDDGVMGKLANKMADAYCQSSFWSDLEFFAERLGVPRAEVHTS